MSKDVNVPSQMREVFREAGKTQAERQAEITKIQNSPNPGAIPVVDLVTEILSTGATIGSKGGK